MSRHMAIIGRGAYPLITPWIDDGRRLPPDLSKPAAANFWRFEGMDRLLTLYKAAWRLKDKTPKSLLALKAEMLDAVDKDADAQTAAVSAYESRILDIVSDVRRCDAAAQPKALALADLTGTTIFCSGPTQGDAPNDVAFNVKLLNRLTNGVTAAVRYGRTCRQCGASGRACRYSPDDPDHPLPLAHVTEVRGRHTQRWVDLAGQEDRDSASSGRKPTATAARRTKRESVAGSGTAVTLAAGRAAASGGRLRCEYHKSRSNR